MFMLIALASNWNLTGGFTGYIDFGHVVFFGIGAYGTGVLMHNGWEFPVALIAGAVFAGIYALIVGYPTLRLKGPYFSIAMLGTFVAVREIIRGTDVVSPEGQLPRPGGGVFSKVLSATFADVWAARAGATMPARFDGLNDAPNEAAPPTGVDGAEGSP